MSWLFSQALVAAYSAGTCSDGEPSALLSGNPIPQAYCAHDKMTAFSRLSRFGMTFKPLTDALGAELLTSYLAGFRAKTLVPQDAEPESPGKNPACGNTWRELLGKYDPSTHTLKTAQCSLFADLEPFSVTLPRWGSMQSGELFRRQTLVPPTAETESGLLPTPLASNTKAHHLRSGGRPARSYLMPTPTASPDAPNHGSNGHGPHNLLGVAQTGWKPGMMWPTPTVCGNHNRKGASANSGDGLATAVATWPTPTAHNAKETNAPSESNLHTPTLAAQAGGALNPTWVEWLMGWPLGWTDLRRLEMDRFQQWLQQHGVY